MVNYKEAESLGRPLIGSFYMILATVYLVIDMFSLLVELHRSFLFEYRNWTHPTRLMKAIYVIGHVVAILLQLYVLMAIAPGTEFYYRHEIGLTSLMSVLLETPKMVSRVAGSRRYLAWVFALLLTTILACTLESGIVYHAIFLMLVIGEEVYQKYRRVQQDVRRDRELIYVDD